MARIGGELEQLVTLKAAFDREAGTVDELTRTIRGQLASTTWEGPAADRFRQMWEAEFEPNMSKLRTALQDAALEVSRRREALMQAGS
ncbi:MAG TPA: WXG100 family type VII secretion target [Nocardioidaceae bacterium]|nr:WXG100 family type VII secretion target [Nocardioidaceae bacterium]